MKRMVAVTVTSLTLLLLASVSPVAASNSIPCNECHRSNARMGAMREAMCLTCHGPGGFSALRAFGHAGLDCLDCHGFHGGATNWLGGVNRADLRRDVDVTGAHSNPWRPSDSPGVLPTIATPEQNRAQVVFESRGTGAGEASLHSFADDDEDRNAVFDGICEVCHRTYLQQTRHHIGETCTLCHPHNNGFRKPGN